MQCPDPIKLRGLIFIIVCYNSPRLVTRLSKLCDLNEAQVLQGACRGSSPPLGGRPPGGEDTPRDIGSQCCMIEIVIVYLKKIG